MSGFRECCLFALLREQGPDGSWPWKLGGRPAIEATAWILLSLATRGSETVAKAAERACAWLVHQQLGDGSWPAQAGRQEGCWVTAPVCLALAAHRFAPDAIRSGVRWLAGDWPAEARWIWRLARRFRSDAGPAYPGWSWTRGSASWVEPTACSLLLLRLLGGSEKTLRRRIDLAESFLAARVSPDGGWNCGDPSLYAATPSSVITTVWALLALRRAKPGTEKERSVRWLESTYPEIRGPGSLALAHLCLRVYGRSSPAPESQLIAQWEANQFLGNVVVTAWAAAALTDSLPEWLEMTEIRL